MEGVGPIAFSQPAASLPEIQAERKAQEFEALVLSQLLKPMFETMKTPKLFGGGGAGEDAFSAMLHEEYAKAIASRGGVGVADQVQAALLRIQSDQIISQEA